MSEFSSIEELSFVRACQYATDGDTEQAIALVSEMDNGDARSLMLRLLANRDREFPPHCSGYMTKIYGTHSS